MANRTLELLAGREEVLFKNCLINHALNSERWCLLKHTPIYISPNSMLARQRQPSNGVMS